jgi:predicted HAD superfamily phosphohydrolase YqeG
MAKKIKTRITFNQWARELRVSSLWDATKPENREFIKRLEDARFAFTQNTNNG